MKKFFITLMCIVMVVCFMPTVAFAGSETTCLGECNHAASITVGAVTTHYDTLQEAFDDSKSGETIVMLKDFENADLSNSVDFTLKNGVTLDGNGHAIRGNSSVKMCIEASGESTIKNVTFQYIHNGSMASQSDCDWYGWTEGKQGTKSAVYAGSFQGTANIINCTFDNADWDAIQMTPKAGATINITGNTFTHSSTTDYSQLRYIHIEPSSTITATINVKDNCFYKTKDLDADAICNIGIWYVESYNMDLTGNYFEYNPEENLVDTNSEVSGTGGIAQLFPARSAAKDSTSNVNPVSYIHDVAYLTEEAIPAAYYRDVTYNTLQDAINSSSVFYLAKDNAENVTVPAGKTIELHQGDYKMIGTVTNNGTMEISSGSNTEGTALITNNGTLSLGCDAAVGYSVTNNATLKIIYGTTYDLSKITGSGTIVITGGTFMKKPDNAWIADSYIANSNEDGTYTVKKMTAVQAANNGKKVASSTSSSSAIYYSSVEAGIADGKSILYLVTDYADAITIPSGKILTLYSNDKNLTGKVTNNGALKLSCPAQVENKGSLVITGGTTHDVSQITNAAGGMISISGGTFNERPDDAWLAIGYVATPDEGATTFTVKKGTITKNDAITAGAVASSSSKYYKTLQEGFQDTYALHLLANVNETVVRNGRIDLYCDNYQFTGSLNCPGSPLYIDNGTAILNSIECATFYGGYKDYTAEVTVKNGTAKDIKVAKNSTVLIQGGTYTGSITVTDGGTGSLTITGGTFSTDPKKYVPENSNYRVRTNSDGTYTVYYSAPYIPSTPTDSLKTARTEAIKAVSDYVNAADYEEAQQAEIKTIVDNAKKDIEAAKTADEIKAIEAAAKAELDKLETAEEMALIRTIEGTQFTARSKATTLNGKKAIRVTWNKPADLDFDGYEIYRSTERYKGYGTEPFFTTTNQKYTNNKGLKVGKTYYYKVRGFKYVNDEKVYTEYSLKAWRTVK